MIEKNGQRLYNSPIPIIGITGGIATGKSSVGKIIKNKNYPYIDADKLVKEIYSESESIQFIKDNFSQAIDSKGQIDFKALRRVFFKSKTSKEIIESFIYKRLPNQFHKSIRSFLSAPFVFYEIPLLFEKKLQSQLDITILVYANEDHQLERLTTRDNLSIELAQSMIDSQLPIDEKKSKSDYIISNQSNLKELVPRTNEIIEKVRNRFTE